MIKLRKFLNAPFLKSHGFNNAFLCSFYYLSSDKQKSAYLEQGKGLGGFFCLCFEHLAVEMSPVFT